MRKILVTGGAGFIGSHLCERLLSEGNEVICLDNFYTGSRKNVLHLLDNPYFEILRHDVTIPCYLEIDEIYNLACPASPVYYQINPIKTVKTSVMGAINMLGLAKRKHAKILQASSSEVYGDPKVHPQKEDYWGYVNPVGIRSCYHEGKRCAETLFMDYHIQNGLKIKILRIFNTYGTRMQLNDGRVMSNFIVQALNGEELTVHGDGMQTRSFLFVDDLVDAMVIAMNTPDEFTGPVNIGNPEEITVMEIAEKIIGMTGSASGISFHPGREDDPARRKPDISLARDELDWEPRVGLEEGLARTIEYFKKALP